MKLATPLICAAAILTMGTACCLAQEAAPPPAAAAAPDVTAPDATVPTVRDPFWPVGYWPQPKIAESEAAPEPETTGPTEPTVVAQWPTLKLRGITQKADGTCLAILEGIGVVEAGSVITLQNEGLIYRWRITSVNPNGVSHVKLDARPAPTR